VVKIVRKNPASQVQCPGGREFHVTLLDRMEKILPTTPPDQMNSITPQKMKLNDLD